MTSVGELQRPDDSCQIVQILTSFCRDICKTRSSSLAEAGWEQARGRTHPKSKSHLMLALRLGPRSPAAKQMQVAGFKISGRGHLNTPARPLSTGRASHSLLCPIRQPDAYRWGSVTSLVSSTADPDQDRTACGLLMVFAGRRGLCRLGNGLALLARSAHSPEDRSEQPGQPCSFFGPPTKACARGTASGTYFLRGRL